jgi:hypothetical protein
LLNCLGQGLLYSSIPAAVQRRHISPDCQRFTLRLVRRTVPIMDSIGFVLREGLQETLTLTRLGVRGKLKNTLQSPPTSRASPSPAVPVLKALKLSV